MAASSDLCFRFMWSESISMHCATNRLLVSRCHRDCAVTMDTLGGGEAELAPAINGSSTACSLWMRLAATVVSAAGEEDLRRGP